MQDLATLRSECEKVHAVVRHVAMAGDALLKREWGRAAQCVAAVMQESTAPSVQVGRHGSVLWSTELQGTIVYKTPTSAREPCCPSPYGSP